jgi:nucleotide-binding universal stress UspA family protein
LPLNRSDGSIPFMTEAKRKTSKSAKGKAAPARKSAGKAAASRAGKSTRAAAAGKAREKRQPKRKFLVIIDNSEEAGRALRFAGRRAEHTGGGLTLLFVVAPADFQHWLNVESIMREEAHAEAKQTLKRVADQVAHCCSIKPELVIREGVLADEIVRLIQEDKSIAILVLAAATGTEGPGPLVSNLAGKAAGTFPIPVTIVPGNLSDEEIDRLA